VRAASIAAGAVVLVLVVAVVAFVVWQWADDDAADSSAVAADVEPAVAPFAGLTAGTIEVGGRRLRVVVADEEDERIQGLRQKSDAAPYDGMLFVFPSDALVSFTMAGVPEPLEIVFYGKDGGVVDRLHMTPCAGTDASCPAYTPRGAFRYALETGSGAVYEGSLAVPR
jgi:uncharacterized membrane protein (UPF0127 family)